MENNKQVARTSQEQIVTQSQLKLAMDWLSTKNCEITLKEVIGVTNILVDYVQFGYSKELGTKISTVDKYFSDKKETK
jgi:hypothetical protein